jgi:hypothetical protein
MAITTFIPEVWSARLLANLQKNLVFGALANRNYEGDIAQFGDTVHINSIQDITVKAYTPNTDIDDPEQLTTVDQTLVIDHGAYYNFYVNDVDAVQARGDLMDAAMRNASYKLSENIEDHLASVLLTAGTITGNMDATKAYESIVAIKTAMDEANVPKEGRKLVVPPSIEGAILLDDRFITGNKGENRLEEGAVAKAAGFDIYISNAKGMNAKVVAFRSDDFTFANQLTKTEAYRREKGFDDGVKGLALCGAKVTRPGAVAVYTIG